MREDTIANPKNDEAACCLPSCCSDTKSNEKAQNSNQQNTEEAVKHNQFRENVRDVYQKAANAIVEADSTDGTLSCCSSSDDTQLNALISTRLGYSQADVDLVPEGANLGLGCGNPSAIASLKAGETVVDLGSGGGFDCFLASPQVGDTGHIIGIDMTPDMISKARNNAEKGQYKNTEFRLGEIEQLPVADNTADVIISNCVINLSPNKPQVFREAFRVLKSGGRIAISDVVATAKLPEDIRNNALLIAACIGNASLIDELRGYLEEAGFSHISIQAKDESREFIKDWAPGHNAEDYVISATIEAIKP